MAKEIICVYQDCVLCGDRGKKIKRIASVKNINIRKVSFASDEGKNLIHEAVFEHGIKTMPFYTDSKKFASDIEEFATKTKKRSKK